jgi:hypothetical protein
MALRLSVTVFGHRLLTISKPFFGSICAAGVLTFYTTWRQRKKNNAAVFAELWNMLSSAAWTAKLELLLPVVAVTVLGHFE